MLYSFELSFYYTRHLPCDLKLIVWKITGCSSSGFQRDLRSDNLNMYMYPEFKKFIFRGSQSMENMEIHGLIGTWPGAFGS
jgi:hypothetical protein